MGILWAIMADRAGRPEISSTFEVLQAFLAIGQKKMEQDLGNCRRKSRRKTCFYVHAEIFT